MACNAFKIGDRVRFRGTAAPDGRLIAVHENGATFFEATVGERPFGMCYGLRWDNGDPVGLPFHDFQLEKVTE